MEIWWPAQKLRTSYSQYAENRSIYANRHSEAATRACGWMHRHHCYCWRAGHAAAHVQLWVEIDLDSRRADGGETTLEAEPVSQLSRLVIPVIALVFRLSTVDIRISLSLRRQRAVVQTASCNGARAAHLVCGLAGMPFDLLQTGRRRLTPHNIPFNIQ